jgi:hypothetical protein
MKTNNSSSQKLVSFFLFLEEGSGKPKTYLGLRKTCRSFLGP